MLEVPADAPAVWLGLALAAAALLAVVGSLPAQSPPDATAAANAIDAVAVADPPAASVRRHGAAQVRVSPSTITLRNDAGTTAATVAFGPVTPVAEGGPLDAVLRGRHPAAVFASPGEFRRAVVEARDAAPTWSRSTRLVVRRASWGGVTVTLVGAR